MKDIVNIKVLKNNVLALKMNRPIDLDPSKRYEVDIKEYKSKKTLQQNNYFWKLTTEITRVENGGVFNRDDLDITYRNLLEMANAKFTFLLLPSDAINDFKGKFRAIKNLGTCDVKGVEFTNLQVFYGISTMNTKEMSNLIDVTLDYAHKVGVADVKNYWEEILRGG